MAEEQQQGISLQQLLQLLGKSGGGNPLIAGGIAGGQMLGQILSQILSPKTATERLQESRLEQRKRLIPQLEGLPEEFSEGEVVKRQALVNRRMQPAFNRLAFNQARIGGRSPQTGRNVGMDIGSLLAGSEFDIRNYLQSLGTQRQQFKFGALSRLT